MSTTTLRKFNKSFTVQGIDEDQRLVYGIASSPTMDAQGDIVTTEAMQEALPAFMEWGNLRYMHQDGTVDAVGKVIDAHIGPDGKTYITAKVVDDSAWAKVKAGVLQAFSIGGEIIDSARHWIENKFANVITRLTLNEISLVDNPAHKEARILLFKSNTNVKGTTYMDETLEPVAGDGAEALAEVSKALEAVSELKKRQRPAVKKAAATPDPEKIENQLLHYHNSLIKAGNLVGAESITDAIAFLKMAKSDGDNDGDEDMAKADGDSAASDTDDDQPDMSKADGVDEQAGNEPEGGDGGPAQDFSQDGSNIYSVTDNETDPDEADDNQPDTKDPVGLSQGVTTRKAQAPSQALVATRVQQIRQSRQFDLSDYLLQKAATNDLKKFAMDVVEVLQVMQDKIEKLESRTVANRGPVRMQVIENRDVAKGMDGGKDVNNSQSQIAELSEQIRKISDPQEREKVGKQLGLIQIRQALGYRG